MSINIAYGWTPERIEIIKKLWAEGLSNGLIADRLGGITRNSVIGKVHRLGLDGRATIKRKEMGRPFGSRNRSIRISETPVEVARNRRPMVFKKQTAPVFPAVPLPPQSAGDIGRVKFSDLEAGHCKWIVGETHPIAMCCGLPRVIGKPYCTAHVERATPASAQPKRKDSIKPLAFVKVGSSVETKLKELVPVDG